ncbi:hypothetical protein KKB18_07975 [bacterium]|nr:hypothetical protein [bacterium]
MLLLDFINVNKNQWKTRNEFAVLQVWKLQRIIKYAIDKVPYYNRTFKSIGITPEDIKSLEDIEKIPILEKERIQNQPHEDFISNDFKINNLHVKCTSGSTGTPLKIFLSKNELSRRILIDYRCLKNLGLKATHTQVYFREPATFRPSRLYQKLGLFKRFYISIFDPVEIQVEKLIDMKPDIVCGDPTILESISSYIRSEKKLHNKIVLKFLISTSQLVDNSRLEIISSTFKAPVYNFYGAIEFGVIGSQCQHKRDIHINSDSTYCELKKTDFVLPEKNHCCEIICTSLDSFAMPIIRYRLGDIVVPSWEKCSCGTILPSIEVIAGRKNEYIMTLEGKKLPPILFTVTLRRYDFVKKFRIHQKKIDKIEILLCNFRNMEKNEEDKIKKDIQDLVGTKIDIRINVVPFIEDDKIYKQRTIISDLKDNFHP